GGRVDGEPVDPQYRAVAVELERPFGERPLDGPLQRVEPARLSHDQDRTSSLTGSSSAVSGVRSGKPAESPGRGKAAPLVQAGGSSRPGARSGGGQVLHEVAVALPAVLGAPVPEREEREGRAGRPDLLAGDA